MRRLPYGLLLVVAACGSIGSPLIISTDAYEFRDFENADTLVFHWKRTDLPVRVWVSAGSPIEQYVQTAITRWQGAFLYGQFRATLVADSNTADVIVRNEPSDIIDNGGLGRRASQCVGVTVPDIHPEAHTLQLPIHVFMYAVVSDIVPGLATCYSITMTHEFGHVLGMINGSHAGTTTADVMFPNPLFDGLSDRDRLSANTLYILAPNLTITGRR